jgi:hypothetical protein
MAERTITYIKTNTLKNGEIKQYECTKKYKTRTTIKRKMGKEIARKKITVVCLYVRDWNVTERPKSRLTHRCQCLNIH